MDAMSIPKRRRSRTMSSSLSGMPLGLAKRIGSRLKNTSPRTGATATFCRKVDDRALKSAL